MIITVIMIILIDCVILNFAVNSYFLLSPYIQFNPL